MKILKIPIGRHLLLIKVRGERGAFGCWNIWIRIGWELKRWH
jgi:hypothetical protein